MTTQANYKFGVIGDWHLGFVTAGVLADIGHSTVLINPMNLGPQVWREFPPPPVREPGLPEMLAKNIRESRLHYANGLQTPNLTCEYYWLAIDTPVNDNDEPNLKPLEEIAAQLAEKSAKALVVSSQIPLGFSAQLQKMSKLPVIYVPENLRLGKGIETFFAADRTVIGCDNSQIARDFQQELSKFSTEFLLANLVTAEMVKHANNIFLATSISFANELARIGEAFGVDSLTVGKALKLDKRIGKSAYVIPGLGFAGGTLPRDLRVVQGLGQKTGIPTPLVNAVLQVNENSTAALLEVILQELKQRNANSVLILGYTYKADTDTLRRSLSLDLAKLLVDRGIVCHGFDPDMNNKDLSSLKNLIKHTNSWEELPGNFGVAVVMTARPGFRELPWSKLANSQTNTLILDTQNLLDGPSLVKQGLRFRALWAPEVTSR